MPLKGTPTLHKEDQRKLKEVVEGLLKSRILRGTTLRERLFRLLWRNRATKTYADEIWKSLWSEKGEYEAKQHQTPSSRGGHHPIPPGLSGPEYLSPNENIRHHCSALANALKIYFSGTTKGWVIRLPAGGPRRGYQLEAIQVNDVQSPTHSFWKAHLDSDPSISIVYVEQLFYLDKTKDFVFRYYDCNSEHSDDAIAELKDRHDVEIPGLIAFHPYCPRGEVEARNSIIKWFENYALEKVEHWVTRDLHHLNDPIWEHSLILFGSALANRFIAKVQRRYSGLPIQLLGRSKVVIQKLTMKEKKRLQQVKLEAHFDIDDSETSALTIEFDANGKTAPVLITRVPHPDVSRTALTIFNGDRGKALEQVADMLTNDEWIREDLEPIGLTPPPFPESFQLLCAASLRSHHHRVYPLAWRKLTSRQL